MEVSLPHYVHHMSTCHHSCDEGAKASSVFRHSFVPYYKCNTNSTKHGRPSLVPRLLPLGTKLRRPRTQALEQGYICVCVVLLTPNVAFAVVYKTVVLVLHFDILEGVNTRAHNAHTHALTPNHIMTVCALTFSEFVNSQICMFAR